LTARLGEDALTRIRADLPAARVDTALAEGAALTPDRATAYALHDEWTSPPPSAPRCVLTPREAEVAVLVAQGLTNPQIASRLHVSTRTVGTHLEHIRAKLDLPSRAQIAVWATSRSA
jgi:serine/threonine-protein kinase PknK